MTVRPLAAAGRARASRLSATWTWYAFLALWGYILYAFGNASQYLRTDLSLSDAQVGLHSSALAAGVLVAGVTIDAVAARVGLRRSLDLGIIGAFLAIALVGLAPAMPVSLAGGFVLGLAGAFVGTQVNIRLGRAGDEEGRKLVTRANAWAMVAATLAPVVIWFCSTQLGAWRLALVLPLAGIALVRLTGRLEMPHAVGEPDRRADEGTEPLPRAFWFAWLLLVISVSIEFSFVFWGSTVVSLRTGVSKDQATLLAALFVAGMLAGRLVLSAGVASDRPARHVLAALLVVAAAGSCLVWASTNEALAAIGLFLGGLGTSGLYPTGVSVALAAAPSRQVAAASRAASASGAAMLVGPTVLGLAAGAVGVVAAWGFLPLLVVAGWVTLAAGARR